MPLDSHKIPTVWTVTMLQTWGYLTCLETTCQNHLGYGILSVMLTMRKTLSLACGKATPQPPSSLKTFDAGLSAWCEYKGFCDVLCFHEGTVNLDFLGAYKPLISKASEKLQKNQKTYRNLCKLPISANDNYISRTRHESFSEKKNTLRPFFWFNKKQQWEKSRATKNPPFRPGRSKPPWMAPVLPGIFGARMARSAPPDRSRRPHWPTAARCAWRGKAETTGIHRGFGWQKNQTTRVYWQWSWAKRHGKKFEWILVSRHDKMNPHEFPSINGHMLNRFF